MRLPLLLLLAAAAAAAAAGEAGEAAADGTATLADDEADRAEVSRQVREGLAAALEQLTLAELVGVAVDFRVELAGLPPRVERLLWEAEADMAFINSDRPSEPAIPVPSAAARAEREAGRAYARDPDAAPVPDGCLGAYPGLCALRDGRETVARRPAAEFTRAEFVREHVEKSRPVVVEGLVAHLGWPAAEAWQFDALLERHGDEEFGYEPKVEPDDPCFGGAADNGTLAGYLGVLRRLDENGTDCQRAFGGLIEDSPVDTPGRDYLTRAYTEPLLMAENDLFSPMARFLHSLGAPVSFSPRYLVMGPRGAGTTLHADFLNTSFWNACVVGSKRWVVFPDTLVPDHITPDEYAKWSGMSNHEWFKRVYPHLGARGVPFDEFTQRAGDVVWTPGGWPHQTINREASVTVTHNLITPQDAARVFEPVCFGPWRDTADEVEARRVSGFPTGEDQMVDGVPRDEALLVAQAVYFCVALGRLFPAVHAQTCCASAAFRERLDGRPAVAAISSLDFEPNSEHLARLEKRAAGVSVRADATVVLEGEEDGEPWETSPRAAFGAGRGRRGGRGGRAAAAAHGEAPPRGVEDVRRRVEETRRERRRERRSRFDVSELL